MLVKQQRDNEQTKTKTRKVEKYGKSKSNRKTQQESNTQ